MLKSGKIINNLTVYSEKKYKEHIQAYAKNKAVLI